MPHNKTRRKKTAPQSRRNPYAVPETETLYGQHTVLEALRNPQRKFKKFLASENALRRFGDVIGAAGLQPEIVRTSDITKLTGPEAVHQGLYLAADPLPSPELKHLISRDGPIIVLDQITDPHNAGAVLRSCAAFAAAGIVMTARHSPSASSVLAKAASGALEHVPISKVTNLARAIEELKDAGAFCIGLDSEGETTLEVAVRQEARIALVLGAEGKGLRQKTRATCSALARVDMPGAIRSLNVSNAAALALYIATRK